MGFDALAEPLGRALAVVAECEIVADDHCFGAEVVFENGLVELLGGAVGELLVEREDDSCADTEGLDEFKVLVEGVDGARGAVGGEDFGGMSVECENDAGKEFLVGEFDGLFDEGLVTEVDAVKGADAND